MGNHRPFILHLATYGCPFAAATWWHQVVLAAATASLRCPLLDESAQGSRLPRVFPYPQAPDADDGGAALEPPSSEIRQVA
jgi:hypothetical protein